MSCQYSISLTQVSDPLFDSNMKISSTAIISVGFIILTTSISGSPIMEIPGLSTESQDDSSICLLHPEVRCPKCLAGASLLENTNCVIENATDTLVPYSHSMQFALISLHSLSLDGSCDEMTSAEPSEINKCFQGPEFRKAVLDNFNERPFHTNEVANLITHVMGLIAKFKEDFKQATISSTVILPRNSSDYHCFVCPFNCTKCLTKHSWMEEMACISASAEDPWDIGQPCMEETWHKHHPRDKRHAYPKFTFRNSTYPMPI
ncbi:hypothetical protein F5884DRAFT_486679 [Xylogone sp. PMI_703]|nr:hypothetical protein F5884DRAFT_486679 [Xylogone sp. PMI_703]